MPTLPFIPFENMVEVAIKQVMDSQEVINTLCFQYSGELGPTELLNLATALDGVIQSSYATRHSPIITYTGLYLRDFTTSTSPVLDYFAVPVTGTAGGATMPNNAAWCIKFLSGLAGRSTRGRNYVAGLSADLMDDRNHVKATWAANMVAFYEALQSAAGDVGGIFCIASRYIDNVRRDVGQTYTVTSIGYTDLVVDSQRDRLPGRGA